MKYLFILLLLLPVSFGAEVFGTVYDFGLNRLSNVVVEIDTVPNQVFVVKNGSYSFSVPEGSYVIFARHDKSDSEISENISVLGDGSYVFDLILLPSLDVEDELLSDVDDVPIVEDFIEDKPASQWFVWLVVFIILGFIVYRVSRPERIVEREVVREVKGPALSDDLSKIVNFIEKEGGRVSQKDVRNVLPYSEAKVSLLIDELESKGLVERIKKGRGNIVVRK